MSCHVAYGVHRGHVSVWFCVVIMIKRWSLMDCAIAFTKLATSLDSAHFC
ncbi:hypothetical protein CCACVL1_21272 [Corchorus capsularis]|uniref:Uncharacterized protein n=1 Tax=Corchorus capsularis TaxID=210143 RepID=A0A1R3H7C4_COCAP|nr:hypothetical protein CCACVL1_21272 [Corchorus capsularis]